jgi:peptidoglycan pentaglycine glycine transferase (the first glycine)
MDVTISKEVRDPAWDSFLETQPDGLYQQSSLWAEVKALDGWRPLRLIVREDGRIVGGVQALLRDLPLFGTVGYVSKGPVVASDQPEAQKFIVNQLNVLARKVHILFLKIQPPYGADALVQPLSGLGAKPGIVPVTPLATFRSDLRPDPDEIMAQMHRSTRSNIRRAGRRGVEVRVGTEADIETFFHIRRIHAEQRGYDPGSEQTFRRQYRVFSDHFGLFLAEYEGQPLAAKTNIAFGDVTFDTHLVDNGLHRELNAPSLLHWESMLWGKARGCAWYDFGGIKIHIAQVIMNDQPIPKTSVGNRAKFKQYFGGELMVRPGVYDLSFIPPRRLTIKLISMLVGLPSLLGPVVGKRLANYVHVHDKRAKRASTNDKD